MGLDRVTFDYESVTVGALAIGLTAAKYSPSGEQHARTAHCSLESGDIRLRVDADPTADEGTLLEVGGAIDIGGIEDIRRIKFIRTGTTSGVVKVRYER